MTGGDDEVTLSSPNLTSRRSMWKSRSVARFSAAQGTGAINQGAGSSYRWASGAFGYAATIIGSSKADAEW